MVSGLDSRWPGFAPFTPLGANGVGFADAWGPRAPQWDGGGGAERASTYLSFAQKVLQEGAGPSADVAVLDLAWGVEAKWADGGLNGARWSYQFPSPRLLGEYGVGVEEAEGGGGGGRRLGAPGYKALVVDNETAMDVGTAELVLRYGKAGLPVVVVGERPRRTFSYERDAEAATRRLDAVFAGLEALQTTAVVGSEAAVPQALEAALGVRPSVRYPAGPGNSSIITYRRTVDTGYLYWIYNNADTKLQTTVQLEGEGYPLNIDLWTGRVSPIPAFSVADGYASLNVTLANGAAAAIYIGATNPFNVSELDTHLTDTTCGSFVKDNAIHIYSNTSCTATTSSGRVVSLAPNSSIPTPATLSSWTLVVEDWSPAHPNATGTAASETLKTLLPPVNLTELAPWPEIKGLSSASGIGVYTTRVRLGGRNGTETSHLRALLHLGDVEGTWELQVNGRTVEGVDLFGSSHIDVTDYVTFATYNEINITVATTLWNKLLAVWPEVFGSEEPQGVGLIGPVTISYADEIVVER